jgi:hypothetical protein
LRSSFGRIEGSVPHQQVTRRLSISNLVYNADGIDTASIQASLSNCINFQEAKRIRSARSTGIGRRKTRERQSEYAKNDFDHEPRAKHVLYLDSSTFRHMLNSTTDTVVAIGMSSDG